MYPHRLVKSLGVLQVLDRDVHEHRAVTVKISSHVHGVSFLHRLRSEQPSETKGQKIVLRPRGMHRCNRLGVDWALW